MCCDALPWWYPTLFGVTLISFLLTVMLPGNPALVKAGPFATPEYLKTVEQQMGLDQPIPVQYRTLCRRAAARRPG